MQESEKENEKNDQNDNDDDDDVIAVMFLHQLICNVQKKIYSIDKCHSHFSFRIMHEQKSAEFRDFDDDCIICVHFSTTSFE